MSAFEHSSDFDGSEDDLDPQAEAAYTCQSCGEEIVVPVDPTAGQRQEYVEDCPVCCRPHVLHGEFDAEYGASIRAEAE